MTTTTFDISAQFGGRDAAQALLPHFRALKSAIKEKSFEGFPFRELAFILRVDGNVNGYGLSGPGYIEFNKKRGYVSVDIGLTREDWAGREVTEISTFVAEALVASVGLLRGLGDARLKEVDWLEVDTVVKELSASYKAGWGRE